IDDKDLANIAPGEGQVVEKNGEKIAVYKNDEGHLSSCSAVCTHMACIVHWNNAEKTWDCPCHASRFSPDGTVLEGPAYNPLRPVGIRGKT
ncbi:MAG: (2Fe-2S)-binding protein, partial [Balneolaceae bacterium]